MIPFLFYNILLGIVNVSCNKFPKRRKSFIILNAREAASANSHHRRRKIGAYCLWKEGCNMTEKKRKRPDALVEAIIAEQRRKDPTDVLGSYTGVPWDEWDDPVQDADDL